MKDKWYQNRIVVVLSLLFLPPVGVYLMATRQTDLWKKVVGIGYGTFATVAIVVSIFQDHYKEGMDAYNKGRYSSAVYHLEQLKPDDEGYADGMKLLPIAKQKADSLEKAKAAAEVASKQAKAEKKAAEKAAGQQEEMASASPAVEAKSTVDPTKPVDETLEMLDKNIQSMATFGAETITENSNITFQMAVFGGTYLIGKDAKSHADAKVKAKGDELLAALKKAQLREMPKFRKEYSKFVRRTVWENDIEVSLSGTRNTVITLTGGLLLTNKNKKDMYTTMLPALEMLRFKQVHFYPYEGGEGAYWDIDVPKDDAPFTD